LIIIILQETPAAQHGPRSKEVLMFRKISVNVILICSAVICLTSLSSATDSSKVVAQTASTQLSLTVADLAKYDGKNGNKAYVAVDSVIYDVSASKSWKNGVHKMGVKAGFDQSEKILKSPHGKSVLKKLPVVGKLIPTVNVQAPAAKPAAVPAATTPAPAAK
jgi:predicted heme/steroid binding protein